MAGLGPPSRLFLLGIFSFDSNAGATCSRLHDFRIRSRARSRTHHRFARCSPPPQRRRRDAPTSDELAFAIMSLSSIFYRYTPSLFFLFSFGRKREQDVSFFRGKIWMPASWFLDFLWLCIGCFSIDRTFSFFFFVLFGSNLQWILIENNNSE